MYDYGKEKRIYPGATSGLGYEFTKLLPKKHNLILIVRNPENLKKNSNRNKGDCNHKELKY